MKVYCQDCERFHESDRYWRTEWCETTVDDYYSPEHEKVTTPKKMNHDNNCSLFEMKKSGKK